MKPIVLLAFIALLAPIMIQADPLRQNALSLGGSARFPLKWDAYGHLSVGTEVLPAVSYFFSDQWEMVATLRAKGTIYQHEFVRTPREPVRYGVQLGVNHYFDFGFSFFPYVGIAGGVEMADFKPISTKLFAELPVGIAFIVSHSLLIQIGAPLKFSWEPPGLTMGTTHVEWSPGYVGAQVFF